MRAWHEFVAAVGDLVPGGVPVLGLALLILVTLGSALWYWFPEWWRGLVGIVVGIARRIARWRPPWRRRRTGEPETGAAGEPEVVAEPEPPVDEELPAVPARTLLVSADELAAKGLFKEAVRERLRAIVRDLVERGVVDHQPGWTVTELAGVAGLARPAAAAPLRAATDLFSAIWYGQRDATAADDAAMRDHAAQVRAALEGVRVAA